MIEFTIKKSYLNALKTILKLQYYIYMEGSKENVVINGRINIVCKNNIIYFVATNRHVLGIIYDTFDGGIDFNISIDLEVINIIKLKMKNKPDLLIKTDLNGYFDIDGKSVLIKENRNFLNWERLESLIATYNEHGLVPPGIEFDSKYLMTKDKFFRKLNMPDLHIERGYFESTVMYETEKAIFLIGGKVVNRCVCKNRLFEMLNGKEQSPA